MIITTKKAIIPANQTIIYGDRLQELCRKAGISFQLAEEWSGKGRWIRPRTVGVIIKAHESSRLQSLIEERQVKRDEKKLKENKKDNQNTIKVYTAYIMGIDALWDSFSNDEKSKQGRIKADMKKAIEKLKKC